MVCGCACGLGIIAGSFLLLFPHCELSYFSPSICGQWVYFLGAQLLLKFCTDCFETCMCFLQVCGCACGLDIVVRILLFIILFIFFFTFSTL